MEYIILDKLFRNAKILMCQLLFVLSLAMTIHFSNSFGFDSANSCLTNDNPSRQGRAQILTAIPCDLTSQNYCNIPGSAYPWHAVRRFVHENQGLMKRMYGDIRHISILRDEFNNNEIDIEDVQLTNDRHSKNGLKRSSKLLHNTDFKDPNKEVLLEPYFRPVSTTPASLISFLKTKVYIQEMTSKPPASTLSTKSAINIESIHRELILDTTSATSTSKSIPQMKEELPKAENKTKIKSHSSANSQIFVNDLIKNKSECTESPEENENPVSNSVYEAPSSQQSYTLIGDNIKVIESPRLGLNIATSADTSSVNRLVATKSSKSDKISPLTSVFIPELALEDPLLKVNSTILDKNINPKLSKTEDLLLHNGTTKAFLKSDNRHTTELQLLNSPTSSTHLPPSSSTGSDLFSSEKIQNVTNSPEILAPLISKPVLRDGQLFQDTIKQETPSTANIRGINACPVKEEVVAPFWANNTRGEVLALLNLYPFEQYVHWEKCTHELKQMYCREGCRCEQQYRLHRLLAYDPHNECRGIFSDWFRFPSCCICKCYDIPLDYRATSRSPRLGPKIKHPFEAAEEMVKNAIYEHATEEWYRPNDDSNLHGL